MHRDSNESERKQNEPDNGVQNQSGKRQRPREKKQKTPKNECEHLRTLHLYALEPEKVPAFYLLRDFMRAARNGAAFGFAAFHCGAVALLAILRRPSAIMRLTRAMLS